MRLQQGVSRATVLAALAVSLIAGCARSRTPTDDLSQYQYEDTKRLVVLVDSAAALLQREGERAFVAFDQRGSRWFNGSSYIFVYTPNGTSVFHPVEPALVGRNLIDLKDMNGKPVVRLIADIAKKPGPNAAGWVFYLWEDQPQLTPMWKVSYVRKAIAPDGKVYLVGSGSYNMKTEKVWVEDRVRLATQLLERKGPKVAFKEFVDAASPFVFLDTYVFVIDREGRTVVDPAYPNMAGRSLLQFRDVVGMPVIQILLQKLADARSAWVEYLWTKPGESLPSRKLIYARKVTVGGKTYIVGSDFYLATPIWMRV